MIFRRLLITAISLFLLLKFPDFVPEIIAQQCPQGQNATGLISAPTISGFGNKIGAGETGVCATGDSSAFANFKLEELNYETLKSKYYNQVKASAIVKKVELKSQNPSKDINFPNNENYLYHVVADPSTLSDGSLVIDNNISTDDQGTGVIFVDKDLDINTNIIDPSENSGLIFVVGGNINIAKGVTEIDAVLVSSGSIYTAGEGCAQNSENTNQLVIKGSLISLNPITQIKFCRVVSGNIPSEKIDHQAKYLVILRNIYSENLQKWSEIQ